MTKEQQEKPIIDSKTLRKMLPAERKAVRILMKDPDMSNAAISKELKSLGYTKDVGYVGKRMSKSELLTGAITKIREHNAEILSRRIVPLALKIHERALKKKDSDEAEKFKWVKLAEDKEFGAEDRRPVSPALINVSGVQNLMLQLHQKGQMQG